MNFQRLALLLTLSSCLSLVALSSPSFADTSIGRCFFYGNMPSSGTSIGGMIVDGGNFDWEAHKDRFPMLNEPDPSYHGAVWTEAVKPMGPVAYIIKARVTLLRDLGSAMSPFNAFQFIQGMETLPLRMRAHCETCQQTPFEKFMWLVTHNIAVFTRSRLGLISIDNKVMRASIIFFWHERPFQACWKTSPTSASQTR